MKILQLLALRITPLKSCLFTSWNVKFAPRKSWALTELWPSDKTTRTEFLSYFNPAPGTVQCYCSTNNKFYLNIFPSMGTLPLFHKLVNLEARQKCRHNLSTAVNQIADFYQQITPTGKEFASIRLRCSPLCFVFRHTTLSLLQAQKLRNEVPAHSTTCSRWQNASRQLSVVDQELCWAVTYCVRSVAWWGFLGKGKYGSPTECFLLALLW